MLKEPRFKIYSNSILIGCSNLEKQDPTMGVAFGAFFPTENYKILEGTIKNCVTKNDFSELNLSVVETLSANTIESIAIAITPPPIELNSEPIEITVLGIPYTQYKNIFS